MKTTKLDFDKFKLYCEKWRQRLGLKNWAFYYEHTKVQDAYARTYWRTSDMAATIQFSREWDVLRPKTDFELDRIAAHEMCHVLLAPLCSEASYRFSTQEAIDTTEHSIVRTLEEVLTGGRDAEV